MSTPNPDHALRGLLALADSTEDAALKLAAAIDDANGQATSTFNEMFETNRVSASEQAVGGIAPTS
jgi:hypothetical protein